MSNEISPAGTAGSASAEPGRQNEAASATATESPREHRSKRRTFTAEYKKAIVAEYDNAPLGSKGAVLRRERLYDSHVMEWRAALTAGLLDGLATRSKAGTPTRTGRPRKSVEQAEIDRLTKERAAEKARHTTTQQQLASERQALDVLGKGVAFLEALTHKNAS